MGRSNSKGRSKGSERFVKLEHWILESEAYRDLAPGPRALLVELISMFNGNNNGDLWLAWRDAALRLNLGTHATAGKYIDELIDHGFIRKNRVGSFNNKTNMATTYILNHLPYRGKPPSKEFMRWRNPDRLRAEKLRLHGSKKGPPTSIIDCSLMPDGSTFQTRDAELPAPPGSENESTYSMPYLGAEKQAA
jgi:hypothetical protein